MTDCGPPPLLPYGRIVSKELGHTTNGAKAYYECSEYGYKLVDHKLWSVPLMDGERFQNADVSSDALKSMQKTTLLYMYIIVFYQTPKKFSVRKVPSPHRVDLSVFSSSLEFESISKSSWIMCFTMLWLLRPAHSFLSWLIVLSHSIFDNTSGETVIVCSMVTGSFPGVNCGEPLEVSNAHIKSASGYCYHNEVKYECIRGHQLRGNDTIACMMNGNWTKSPTFNGKAISYK